MSKTVILSPVGGQAIHGIVEYFRSFGFRIVGIDSDPMAVGQILVDRFLQVPLTSELEYGETILRLLRSEKNALFISWLNPEIEYWNRRFLEKSIPLDVLSKFAFSFHSLLDELSDKWGLYVRGRKNGLPVCETRILSNPGEVFYPAFMKPRRGYGSRSTSKISSQKELEILTNACDQPRQYVIQPYLIGKEFTVDFFSRAGQVVNIVVRERIRSRGVSMIGDIVFRDDIEEIVSDFSRVFQLEGVNNVQLIETKTDCLITDFNPRPSGTIMLSVHAGVDLLHNLVNSTGGINPISYGKPKRVRMRRILHEYYEEF